MFQVLIVLQVIVAVALIALVLLQRGKGADMGAAFGSGASATVFGSRGSGSFLSRITAVLAVAFFVNSLVLSLPVVTGRQEQAAESVTERIAPPSAPEAPAEPISDLPVVPEGGNDLPQ